MSLLALLDGGYATRLGDELTINGEFDAAGSWNLTGSPTIAGGVLNLGTTQFNEAIQFNLGGGMTVAVGDKLVLTVLVNTVGDASPVVRMGENGVPNDVMVATPLVAGVNTFNITVAVARPSLALDIFNSAAGTVAPVIERVSVRKVAAALTAITGTSSLAFSQTATISATGTLAGTSAAQFGQSGAIIASGALSGSSALQLGQSATLKGVIAATGTSALTFGTSANGSLKGVLLGTSALAFGQSGSIAGKGSLTGASALQFGQSATTTGGASLSGSSSLSFGQTGTITGKVALSGSTALTFAGSATGSTGAALSQITGASALAFTGTAAGQLAARLFGTATLGFNVQGVIAGASPKLWTDTVPIETFYANDNASVGSWTEIAQATGTYTPATEAGGTWTDTTPARGSWN